MVLGAAWESFPEKAPCRQFWAKFPKTRFKERAKFAEHFRRNYWTVTMIEPCELAVPDVVPGFAVFRVPVQAGQCLRRTYRNW